MSYYSRFDSWRLGLDEDTSITCPNCRDGEVDGRPCELCGGLGETTEEAAREFDE